MWKNMINEQDFKMNLQAIIRVFPAKLQNKLN